MKLYDYFRSSAAYRVRIALNIKGVDYQLVPVNLKNGEQSKTDYLKVSPAGLVPALETDQGVLLQSLAIVEWLDENYPQPSLLPADTWFRARVRAMAYSVACDIHPLNNLRVLSHLKEEKAFDNPVGQEWYHHWIHSGFQALELQAEASPFCFGDSPTLADVCLVPQVYNAYRFKVDMDRYPKLASIWNHCQTLEAFMMASPEEQPDGM